MDILQRWEGVVENQKFQAEHQVHEITNEETPLMAPASEDANKDKLDEFDMEEFVLEEDEAEALKAQLEAINQDKCANYVFVIKNPSHNQKQN